MTKETLKHFEKKGFNISIVNRYASMVYLLLTCARTYSEDMQDYLKSYKLDCELKNELYGLNKKWDLVHSKLRRCMNTDEMAKDYLQDYEILVGMIEKFANFEKFNEK